MKRLCSTILFLAIASVSFGQTISAWEQFYSNPGFYWLQNNETIFLQHSAEVILLDKVTMNPTKIMFPPEARNWNRHNSSVNGYTKSIGILMGPDSSILLAGALMPTVYFLDNYTWNPLYIYNGDSIKHLSFCYNRGGKNVYVNNSNQKLSIFDGINTISFDSTNSPLPSLLYSSYVTVLDNHNILYKSDNSLQFYNGSSWVTYNATFFNNEMLSSAPIASNSKGDFSFRTNLNNLYTYNDSSATWSVLHIPMNLGSPVYFKYDSNDSLWMVGNSRLFRKSDSTFIQTAVASTDNIYAFMNVSLSGKFIYRSGLNNYYTFDINNFSVSRVFSDPSEVLPGEVFLPSLKDNNGNLWFGTYGDFEKPFVRYDGQSWKSFGSGNIGGLTQMMLDTGNTIIAAGINWNRSLIVRLKDSVTTNLDKNDVQFTMGIGQVAMDKGGAIWFGGRAPGPYFHGFLKWAIDSLQEVRRFAEAEQTNLSYTFIDSNNNKWLYYSPALLYMYDDVNWTVYDSTNWPLPSFHISHITLEPNTNKIWFSTEAGFVKYYQGVWTIIDSTNSPLHSNHGEYVYFDSPGRQWFCTQDGLAMMHNNNWEVYTTANSPLRNNDVESVVMDNDCNLWICTEKGINKAIIGCDESEKNKLFTGTVYSSTGMIIPHVMVHAVAINDAGNDIIYKENTFTDSAGNFVFVLKDTFQYYFRATHSKSEDLETAYADNFVIQDAKNFNLENNSGIHIYLESRNKLQGKNELTGDIKSKTERAGHIRVVLMNDSIPVAETHTNQKGRFVFGDLPEGVYSVWVDKPGLNNQEAPELYLSESFTYKFELFPEKLVLKSERIGTLKSNQVFCYPNPFDDKLVFKIRLIDDMHIRVRLYNMMGQSVYNEYPRLQFGDTEYSVTTKSLEPGIYFYSLMIDGVIYNGKILKN